MGLMALFQACASLVLHLSKDVQCFPMGTFYFFLCLIAQWTIAANTKQAIAYAKRAEDVQDVLDDLSSSDDNDE